MRMNELYAIGQTAVTGSLTFTADDIIAYARKYDPQRFHVDPETAMDSLFGGLCASGWHTCAGWMKCFVEYWMEECARLAADGRTPPYLGPSPGFKKLRWLKPVFAGDTITYSVTLLGSRALNSKPGWILNTLACTGANQHGATVLSFESTVLEFEEAL